jgi:hypothetical protein
MPLGTCRAAGRSLRPGTAPIETRMAVRPDTTSAAADPCRLAPFQVAYADRVLSWIRTAQEAFWLAPRTKPPLTAEEVLHWQTPGHQRVSAVPPARCGAARLRRAQPATGLSRPLLAGPLDRRPGLPGSGLGATSHPPAARRGVSAPSGAGCHPRRVSRQSAGHRLLSRGGHADGRLRDPRLPSLPETRAATAHGGRRADRLTGRRSRGLLQCDERMRVQNAQRLQPHGQSRVEFDGDARQRRGHRRAA